MTFRLRRAGVRVASILRWTRTHHLWHPRDITAPLRGRDGASMPYLNRNCRLTRCVKGMVKRSIGDLTILASGAAARPEAAAFLASRRVERDRSGLIDIEVFFSPGKGHFSGRADCNVLVVLDDAPPPRRLVQQAHLVLSQHAASHARLPVHLRLDQFDEALETIVRGGPSMGKVKEKDSR